MSEAPVSVLLVDDHALFRRGLRQLLAEYGFEIVGEAGNGAAGARLAEELAPDVVLMDLEMPGVDGRAGTRRIVQAGLACRVLVLTLSVLHADVLDAITAGASGYLLKDAPVEQIVAGIHAAAQGHSMISPPAASSLVARVREQATPERAAAADALTAREREVLGMIAEGHGNAEIAQHMHLSASTVKNHTAALFDKLGVENRVQAAVH